jgi:hypothetical protein
MCAVGEAKRLRKISPEAQKEYDRVGMYKVIQYQPMLKLLKTQSVFSAMLHGARYHVRDHEALFEE